MLHCFPALQILHWRVFIVHTHTCIVCAVTKAGLGSYSEHFQLVMVFILSADLSIDCPFIYNLTAALLHQPLIYYNLGATQKEYFNLLNSKNGKGGQFLRKASVPLSAEGLGSSEPLGTHLATEKIQKLSTERYTG